MASQQVTDGLRRYRELVQKVPERFSNPQDAGFEILLEEVEIREAMKEQRSRLETKGLPTSWSDIGVVFEDEYLLVLRDAVRFRDGTRRTYLRIIDRPGAGCGVVILATSQQRIVLVRHFRHATRDWHLELPRGFGEPNVSNEENARRELLEEVGAQAGSFTTLGYMHIDTGMSSTHVALLYTEVDSVGAPEHVEGIDSIKQIPLPEFEDMVRDGRITDSFTLCAYARAKLLGMF